MIKLNWITGHPIPDQDARERLFKMREHSVLTDMALSSEKRLYPCHRIVVAKASPYVHGAMNMQLLTGDSKLLVVAVGDFLDAQMQHLLEYIYLGTLLLDPKDFHNLSRLANKLLISVQVDKLYNPMRMKQQSTVDLLNGQDYRALHDINGPKKGYVFDAVRVDHNSEKSMLSVTTVAEVSKLKKAHAIKVTPAKANWKIKFKGQQDLQDEHAMQINSEVCDENGKKQPNAQKRRKKNCIETIKGVVEPTVEENVACHLPKESSENPKSKKTGKNDPSAKTKAVIQQVDQDKSVVIRFDDLNKKKVQHKLHTSQGKDEVIESRKRPAKTKKVHAVATPHPNFGSNQEEGLKPTVLKGLHKHKLSATRQCKADIANIQGFINIQPPAKDKTKPKRRIAIVNDIIEVKDPVSIMRPAKLLKNNPKSVNKPVPVDTGIDIAHEDRVVGTDPVIKKKPAPRKPAKKKVQVQDDLPPQALGNQGHQAHKIAPPNRTTEIPLPVNRKSIHPVKITNRTRKRAMCPNQSNTSSDECFQSTKIAPRAKKRKLPPGPVAIVSSQKAIEEIKSGFSDVYELDPIQEALITIRPKRNAFFAATKRMADNIAALNEMSSRFQTPTCSNFQL